MMKMNQGVDAVALNGFALSPAQSELWLARGTAEAGTPCSAALVSVEGTVEEHVLVPAVQRVVARHEILRTRFLRRPGLRLPLQVVGGVPEFTWSAVPLPPSEARPAVDDLWRETRWRRVDAGAEPPLRVLAASLDGRVRFLLLSLPAPCADARTLRGLVSELAQEYRAVGSGGLQAGEPCQYAQFAEWQNQLLGDDDDDAREGRAYWHAVSSKAAGRPPLPFEVLVKGGTGRDGRCWQASQELRQALGARSAEWDLPSEALLLAAWVALIARVGGRDVPLLVRVEGRDYPELQGALGPLGRQLPLHAVADPGASFRELAAALHAAVREATRWQEYLAPAEDPPDALGFELFSTGAAESAAPAFTVERLSQASDRTPLALAALDRPGGLEFELCRDVERFRTGDVDALAAGFDALLGDALRDPARRIARLRSLDAAGRSRVLASRVGEACGRVERRVVDEVVSRHADRVPGRPALVFEDVEMTYGQLAVRVRRLAHWLRRRGVGPEARVALALPRSPEMIVGALGVLAARAAYVPIDPAYPDERCAFILADSGAGLLVTLSAYAARLSSHGVPTVCLDREDAASEADGDAPPAGDADPRSLAYVIYTSGSTGRPKGVAVEHAQVLAYVDGVLSRLGLPEGASFASVSTLSADLGYTAVFGALCSGGTLHLLASERVHDGDAMAGYFRRRPVDCLKIVPSHLAALMKCGDPQGLLPRRRLVLGGEAANSAWLRELHGLAGACAVYNHYGPTETTVGVLAGPLPGAEAAVSTYVPLGAPLAAAEVYVLDADGEPVGAWESGELCVGGASVARGYLGRPALTAERFVPNPFASMPGARFYRTGDVARAWPGGGVEFLGRLDGQVKIRGFRIDPGEVEAALLAHPDVSQAAVVARQPEGGEPLLVAYVVCKDVAPAPADLVAALGRRLPDYMLPAALVKLAALPLTPNGKLDRAALPAPEAVPRERPRVAPRTVAEAEIAGIWAEVLGWEDEQAAERLGVDDDFFRIGGHSLLAAQVVSRVRQQFGVDLPLRALFDTPTVAGLAAAIDALDASRLPPVTPTRRDAPLPLSYAQQRMWFLAQLEPDNPLYNMPTVIRIEGDLDVQALERTLGEIVARHEVLRTAFVSIEGQPRQVVPEPMFVPLAVEDLAGLPRELREAELFRRIQDEARRPFDLAAPPLLRARGWQLGERDHVVLLNVHHIASDGWSRGVLVREIGALYAAFHAGRPSPLAGLAVQYADFAAWQRSWLDGGPLERQLDYWKARLAGAPTLVLPADHPRPAVPSGRGAGYSFVLGAGLTEALRELSQQAGITQFMTLLAAFKVLLLKYSGQADVVVGTVVAGRNRLELEDLIGFFVNTLVLRSDLGGDPPFTEVLRRVRETVIEAHANQDVPFERLVETLRPERNYGLTPLFQVLFTLQSATLGTLDLPGLRLTPMTHGAIVARFDLALALEETASGLLGYVEYSSDLFSEASIARLAEDYVTLLQAVVEAPARCLHELRLLSEAQRRTVIEEWNATRRAYPRDKTIVELFAEQACRRPDAPALRFAGREVSYAELDGRSQALARELRARGVGLGARVGLLLERSAEMVIAMLGVLKTGAAYVPLDAATPRERVGFVVADAGIEVLVSRGALASLAPGHCVVVDPEGPWEARDAAGAERPSRLHAQDPAYLMYTSGSTGRPKGVWVSQRAVVRLVVGSDYVSFGPEDRVAQASNAAFDAATFEIWGALLNGGCLVGLTRDELLSVDLGQRLREERISVLFLTTALFHRVVSQGGAAELSSVNVVVAGGEALEARWARPFLAEAAPARLVNGYGPTENTTFSVCCNVADVAESGTVEPIGRPIANSTAYVLDHDLEPVGVGVVGDLYVGGDGVALGYLGRPVLTADAFIPDPFSEEGGARLYRTGDRARYRSGGVIEFLGRTDGQVKLRGFRIELGEIEAELAACPGVRDAVVTVAENARGEDRRLVAYLTAHEGVKLRVGDVRESLLARLPDYMVPARMAVLDALPLTPNGKVDRRALRPPDVDLEAGPHAPAVDGSADPTVDLLAQSWCSLLGVRQVSADDDFFDLGGHSLLATQLVSRVEQAFQVRLPLRSIFDAPRLADMAEAVRAVLRGEAAAAVPPLVRAPRAGGAPLSFAQQRLWFLDQLVPDSPVYNIPTALRLRGRIDEAALERTLGEIVRRHEALRTSFPSVDGRPVQETATDAAVPLVKHDLSALPDVERETRARELAEREAATPFSVARGPLVRATLLRLSDEEHVLLLTLHHIVADGWSMGVLIRELAALYAAFLEGRAAPLPELPIQYADFAAWQRAWLTGAVLDRQLAYWRERLSGAPALLTLPTDRPRPGLQSWRGAREGIQLPAELTARLQELARSRNVTLFMVLLAAFQALLARYSGQDDVVVGTPIANRGRVETEGLIGFFANTLVLRTDLSGEPTVAELLARVREVALGAYAHQDLPFEKLVEELQPERDLSHHPLFQAMLVLQNAPAGALDLPGLQLDAFGGADTVATTKFDLTLSLSEAGGTLSGALEYSMDLFTPATVRRLLGHWRTLLDGFAAGPERRVSELPLMDAGERSAVIAGPNRTDVRSDQACCVHELFERQAGRTPEAVAAVFGERRIGYAELDRRAAAVARHLHGLGVGPESVVGLYVERSLEMVIGVLGVLKSGAAYVPLDPAYPRERVQYMLSDARVSVALTCEALRHDLPADILAVTLDGDLGDAHAAAVPAVRRAHPDNLAYVIYTSGSTGRPKGIGLTHAALANLVLWHGRNLLPGARTLQFASLSFDASFHEMFAAWHTGGELVVLSEDERRDLRALARVLDQRRVEKAVLPVVVLQRLAEENARRPEFGRSLRQVVTTGEQLVVTGPMRELFTRASACELHNHYGPSETHVVTALVLDDPPSAWPAHPSLGRPIDNCRCYVLDRHMEPVPVGVPGELYLGGVALARGYVGRPGLTAEKFVPDPWSGEPGARLYRTGDRSRLRADGTFEFLGRLDHQVKVRGFRVEPAEVEALLSEHPAVSGCVVLLREHRPGDRRLVAYVASQADPRPAPAELRAFLGAKLPDYMVPSAVVVMEALPLSPNLKVDRTALPAPGPAEAAAYVPPTTPAEELIAAAWADVLGLERVGVQDNFFSLGGHSLLATQVMARLQALFPAELPLRTLFERPTVAGQVAALADLLGGREQLDEAARTVLAVARLSADEVAARLAEPESE